jgi:hypothetical protein
MGLGLLPSGPWQALHTAAFVTGGCNVGGQYQARAGDRGE